MAEVYEVLEKTKGGERTGRYDMTRRTDDPRGGPYPCGYFGGWPGDLTSGDPETDKAVIVQAYGSEEAYQAFLRREEPLRAKYHTGGHESRQAAHACYAEFQLDHDLRFYEEPEVYRACAECGTLTTARGGLQNCSSSRSVPLCPAHQDRDIAAKRLT